MAAAPHEDELIGSNLFDVMDKCGGYYCPYAYDQTRLHKHIITDLKERNYNVHHVKIYIGHDGCDREGYESDLLDLVVWVTGPDGEYESWNYHTEQWYTTFDGPPPYLFHESFSFESKKHWKKSMTYDSWFDLSEFLYKLDEGENLEDDDKEESVATDTEENVNKEDDDYEEEALNQEKDEEEEIHEWDEEMERLYQEDFQDYMMAFRGLPCPCGWNNCDYHYTNT